MSKRSRISAEDAIANILNFVDDSDDESNDLAELNGESGIYFLKKHCIYKYVYIQECHFRCRRCEICPTSGCC